MTATIETPKTTTAEERRLAELNYLNRMPMIRQALIVRVPDRKTTATGHVTVTEQQRTVLLGLEDFSGLERSVQLTLPEARAVADHLNKVCTRIHKRKDYMP
jgi:hypothetical protein